MAQATRPAVEIKLEGAASRKRTLDEATENAQEAKRRKADLVTAKEPSIEGRGTEVRPKPVDTARIHEAIETQFSLEILLKHNELRLINQELAKCQVALEQLRRCHLIPYPQAQRTTESMLNITNGVGPAVSHGEQVPRWAPAYGVADGPYTRHYAKWLIPDPSFDGVHVEWSQRSEGSRSGKTVPEGRSTRHHFEATTPGSKPRSQRGSAGQKLQALSSGYPQAKGKAGPCILRRGDGQMVKLVCLDCHREDFSSTQGFINHCRIAHRRDFKSHEEAAVASGQPVEVDELGGVLGEEKSPAAATGLVHPLIRSAPTDREAYKALLSRINDSLAMFEQGRLPGVTSIPSSPAPPPATSTTSTPRPSQAFVPSPNTPHLSDLMRRRGFSGNLTSIVNEAQERVDFADRVWEDEESDAGEGSTTQQPPTGLDGASSPRPPSRMPAMSLAASGRPSSSKGVADARNGRKPGIGGISPRMSNATPFIVPQPLAAHFSSNHHDFQQHHEPEVDADMFDGPSIVDLSPNTIASNNAPSLVSDDGEYDEGEDDAESASSEEEDEGSDVAEIDIEDDVMDKVVPRNRSGSGVEMRLRKEGKEKHVTFVSPVKETKERPRRK